MPFQNVITIFVADLGLMYFLFTYQKHADDPYFVVQRGMLDSLLRMASETSIDDKVGFRGICLERAEDGFKVHVRVKYTLGGKVAGADDLSVYQDMTREVVLDYLRRHTFRTEEFFFRSGATGDEDAIRIIAEYVLPVRQETRTTYWAPSGHRKDIPTNLVVYGLVGNERGAARLVEALYKAERAVAEDKAKRVTRVSR